MLKLNHKDNNLRKNITLYKHKFIVFNSIIKDKKIKSSLRWLISLQKQLVKKKLILDFCFNLDWDLFYIHLNEFGSFIITNERSISWVLSILAYIYFYYYCYNYYILLKKEYQSSINDFSTISYNEKLALFRLHCLSFLEQRFLIKIAIFCFILVKFKVLIKIVFFKHAGSLFCLSFLFAQSIFIKYMFLLYFGILRDIKNNTSWSYLLFTMPYNYNRYFFASFFAIFLLFFDFIFVIFKNKL